MQKIVLREGYHALVDDRDYAFLNQFSWRARIRPSSSREIIYAITSIPTGRTRSKNVFMHRLIKGGTKIVDHKNGDGLDNRRSNLRECSSSQNRMNCRKATGTSSIYKGVTFDRQMKRWRAQIGVLHRLKFLGYFDNEIDAAVAYNIAAQLFFGEFAYLNTFPYDQPAQSGDSGKR
jgi:hypothetical protein